MAQPIKSYRDLRVYQLDFALYCGYLAEEDHAELRDDYDHIGGMLSKMMDNPEVWCKHYAKR